jgi:hypothetical protein
MENKEEMILRGKIVEVSKMLCLRDLVAGAGEAMFPISVPFFNIKMKRNILRNDIRHLCEGYVK